MVKGQGHNSHKWKYACEQDTDLTVMFFFIKLGRHVGHREKMDPIVFALRCYISFEFTFSDIDECAENDCMNNATCRDGVNSYDCICPPGFAGNLCETSKANGDVSDFWIGYQRIKLVLVFMIILCIHIV